MSKPDNSPEPFGVDDLAAIKTSSKLGANVVIAALLFMLVAAVAGFAATFLVGRMPQISLHGWIAMALGVVFTFGLGAGLMRLSYYSAKNGFDDRADPGRKPQTKL
jgi:hypothetical protein